MSQFKKYLEIIQESPMAERKINEIKQQIIDFISGNGMLEKEIGVNNLNYLKNSKKRIFGKIISDEELQRALIILAKESGVKFNQEDVDFDKLIESLSKTYGYR